MKQAFCAHKKAFDDMAGTFKPLRFRFAAYPAGLSVYYRSQLG